MIKKIFATGLIVLGLLALGTNQAKAVNLDFLTNKVKPYQAAGNFKPEQIIEAMRKKHEGFIKENWAITGRNVYGPESTSIRLEVAEGGKITGSGKIGSFEATWSGEHDGHAQGNVGSQQGEYFFALTGQQNGTELKGEAIVKFTTKIGLGNETYRTEWEARQSGDTIKGKVFSVYQGMPCNFELQAGEQAEIEISDEIMGEMEEELDKSGVVVVDQGEREAWKTNVLGMNQAYVIVDGEKKPFTDGMELQPGMIIETEGEEGLAVFTTSSGEYIRLQGNGTRIKLMTADSVKDEEWKQLIAQYGKKGPVTVMQAGQMVIKYETEKDKGWWNPGFISDQEAGEGGSVVGFARNVYSDPSGKEKIGISDEDEGEPVKIAFKNNSLVEYLYDNEKIEIKVYEGEAIGYRIDLNNGKKEEIIRAKVGESLIISLDEYEVGVGETGIVKGEFDVNQKSEMIKEFEKLSQNKTNNWLLIGSGLGIVAIIILLILKTKTLQKT